MGHAIYLLVPLFMPNTTFADANSLARLRAYQSNRLLPQVQAVDMVDTLHFNIVNYSWVDERLYAAEQSNIYGNMSAEDWNNLDLSLESNPKAKEAIEWLLAKYIWEGDCHITPSDIDGLITKYESLNGRANNAVTCIGFACPRDTPIDLLTERLVDTSIIRTSSTIMGNRADLIRVTTKEAIVSGTVPRMGTFFYRKSASKAGWVNNENPSSDVTNTIFTKGSYLYLLTTYDRY